MDTGAPRIIASSILQGAVVPAGTIYFTVQLDEPVRPNFTLNQFRLVAGSTLINATNIYYAANVTTITGVFAGVSPGAYTLRITSFLDAVAHPVDGERHPTNTVPSGNGTAGGNFEVDITVIDDPAPVVTGVTLDGQAWT